MTAGQGDSMLAGYAAAARRAGDGACVCTADGSPFGAGHYDELDGMPPAAGAGQLRVRQPDRRRRTPRRRDGARPEMVELARLNATEAGLGNVAFLHGTIDHVPLGDASVDVVISNCVIVLPLR